MIHQLEQLVIEDRYAKKHIYETLSKSIGYKDSSDITTFKLAIYTYISKTYYPSKNIRIAHLASFDIDDVVKELLIIILPMQSRQPIQAIAGQLAGFLKYDDIFDGIKTASELIALGAHSNVWDILSAKTSETGSLLVTCNYKLDDLTLFLIERTKYLPPLICNPKEIVNNNTSGYLSFDESVLLGKNTKHTKPLALDVLNLSNKIRLSIDLTVLALDEISSKPLNTKEQVNNFNLMVNTSNVIYQELLDNRNKFYFNWKYDSRGRLYSCGYHLNIQGAEYKRALINLEHKEVIT